MRSRIAVIVSLGLVLGFGLTTVTPEPAAAAGTLKASPSKAMAKESVTLTGSLPPRAQRTVELQRRVNGAWKRVGKAKKSSSKGTFTFKVSATATTKYRVRAKAVTIKRKKYKAVATSARTVTIVKQSGTVRPLPGVSQPGTGTAASGSASNVVTARFSPARKGRTVTFEHLSGGTWQSAGTAKQDAKGNAFLRTTRKDLTWRARAGGFRGAASHTTAQSTLALQPPKTWEFNGLAAGAEQRDWTLAPGSGGESRTCATPDASMTKLSGGTLQVSSERVKGSAKNCKPARKTTGAPFHRYLNGHVTTQNSFSFTHGVAAARIKFPKARGAHGAFWVQRNQATAQRTGTAGGAEIDVIESFGGTGSTAFKTFIHAKAGTAAAAAKDIHAALGATSTWHDRYRVYSVEWTPTTYIFRIDGVETFRTTKYPSDADQFLVLSMLSSDYELQHNDGKAHRMNVDWVKVWKTNP